MGDREAERELTRRDLMALGGLAAPVGALVVARAFRSDTTQTPTDDYGEAIGPRRLNAEPADIIAEFANERPGTLMAYCQLFWPIYRQASKIDELERLCIGYLGSANDDDPYRIRALPALAHAHALGSSHPDYRAKHESYVIDALKAGRGAAAHLFVVADREILELIWRGLIGALIRNRSTWTSFRITGGLADEALSLVKTYLAGEDVLFSPAVLAWQFLLTYTKAAGERSEDASQIHQAMDIVRHHKSQNAFWFAELDRLYEGRTSFDQVYPQLGEVFIAQSYDNFDAGIRDYAAKHVLYKLYINDTYGGRTSYVTPSRAELYEAEWPAIVRRYGFRTPQWARMRESPSGTNFPAAAAAYISERLAIELPVHDPHVELRERNRARNLGLWVPFRKREEERIFRKVFGNQDLEQARATFADGSEEALRAVWAATIAFEGLALAEQCDLSLSKKEILDRSFQIVEPKLAGYIGLVADLRDRAASLLRVSVLAVGVGAVSQPLTEARLSDVLAADLSEFLGEREVARRSGASAKPSAGNEEAMPAGEYAPESPRSDPVISIVQEGLDAVIKDTPAVTRQFLSAFNERGLVSELVESEGLDAGLEPVLSSLLRIPPSRQLIEIYDGMKKATEIPQSANDELLEQKAKLLSAVVGVEANSPATLRRFKQNLDNLRVPASYAVGALFLLYIKNKEAYPY